MADEATSVLTVVPAVDVACFCLRPAERDLVLEVLLVRRTRPPAAGSWALPGGVVRAGERLTEAARRVLHERTGLDIAYLEQLYTFDDPARDPRGRTLSVAHLALVPVAETGARPGRDVEEVVWWPLADRAAIAPLAFDHDLILGYAHERLRGKLDWTPLVFRLLPPTFTLPEARRIFEAIQGERYNDSNFRRQLLARFPGLEAVPEKDHRTNRPAQLFRYAGPHQIAGPPDLAAGH
jgi:8-oxo-dGTP diphosphatase